MDYMSSGDNYIEVAAIQKLNYAIKVKEVNDELLEQLASSLRWLLYYSTKHNIPLPETEKIILLIDRAIEIANKLPTSYQPKMNNPSGTTEDGTEPPCVLIFNVYPDF